jgi:F0F1-type ATP synthase membrane subunit b/b'
MGDVIGMECQILGTVVACLLLIILVMQFQMRKIKDSLEETNEEISEKILELQRKENNRNL